MDDMLIKIGSAPASDSWGFVGVVYVGDVEAYRTLEAFRTPDEAAHAAQDFMADLLGEMLAGREWRAVRDDNGRPPLRQDFNLSALRRNRPAEGTSQDHPSG
jgi:hypothetical protein